MAGSAAGIEKARAARMAKVAARRAARIAAGAEDAPESDPPANSPAVPNSPPIDPNNAPTVELLTAADCSSVQVSENQTLQAAGILAATAQSAAITVQRVCSGRLRAPVAVRVQASLTVLQGLGLLGVKPGASSTDVDAAAGAVLAKLGEALRFRDRRESASDANILATGRTLEAEKPTGSGS